MSGDGFCCQRCGGLTETLIDLDPATGRTRVRFRCEGCGLTASSARVGDAAKVVAGGRA